MENIMVRTTIGATQLKIQWEYITGGTMCYALMLDTIKNIIIVQGCIGLGNQKSQSCCHQQE
jgi:hypothetical protein